ncbi:hypothetical protein HDA32_002504 [Spinactinospora alkalitolerans]|uniref:Uncharacterized protein n=1 Tax=Spinactinospora alkalitolerans TaxID=687207 RepID=A0A852TZJ0_9ACTN|nr:hypothetical protein [Spinactinospora alkalitolerans]
MVVTADSVARFGRFRTVERALRVFGRGPDTHLVWIGPE